MRNKKIIGLILCVLVISAVFTVGLIHENGNVAYAFDNGEIFYGDYNGTIGAGESEIENIYYASKKVTFQKVCTMFPNCYNINDNLTNCCANTAGVNILTYYDRFYDELIPDYTPGFMAGSNYMYYGMPTGADKKQAVINTLYSYMKTNTLGSGTTQADFKNGLNRYVNEKNRQISYNSILTNSAFDLNKFIEQLDNGKIVILYLKGLNFCNIIDKGDCLTIAKLIYENDAHIEIAYGYQKIELFDANGALISTKLALFVGSGINGIDGMYLLDNNGVINGAEVVNIY